MTAGAAPGLRAHRNWLLLLAGQAICVTGTHVIDTTVVLWIATLITRDKPRGPGAVGGVVRYP